jgi:hypothetical protein
VDAGVDAGQMDAMDAGLDAGTDAGFDGGTDAGVDAGADAGIDGGPGCLTVSPGVVDFGPVVPGCSSRQWIALRNTCSSQQSASLAIAAPFSSDAGTVTVGAGASVEVPLFFSPTALGAAAGVATAGSAAATLHGEGVAAPATIDSFVVAAQPQADVLFVISDGPGMTAGQQWLATNFSSLLQYATASAIDFRLGVLTGRPDGGPPTLVSSTTPSLEQRFVENVELGELGSSTGSCITRAVDELSRDAGWLRPGASFGLVCVQNTVEQLPGSPSAWLRTLRTAAGTPEIFSVSAVANFVPGCAAPDDLVLRTLAHDSLGASVSICAPDAGATGDLGKSALGFRDTFFLSRAPAGGVTVQVDGVTVPASAWTYDPARNAVVVSPFAVPEPGKTLTVHYAASCSP